MSNSRYLPLPVRCMLWGRASGRCEFDGCNKPLTYHPKTKDSVNIADVSHIIGFSKDGPRGEEFISKKLAGSIDNLMLLCKECHKLIDTDKLKFTNDFLREMKINHESRIEIATSIVSDKQSHMVLYGANVGKHSAPFNFSICASAMFPDRFPAENNPISIGMINSSVRDNEEEYWNLESKQLIRKFNEQVKHRLSAGSISHLSIFAFAPQPLLILLGSLLSDIPTSEVYQLHKEPPDWRWQEHPNGFRYVIEEPSKITKIPALVFSLSATINSERVKSVLGNDISIWKITIDKPNNDFLKSKLQLRMFREQIRLLLDKIKSVHCDCSAINIFPAMPVATAVEFGRVLMPKADLPINIYDENRSLGGFQLTTIRLAT